MGHFVKVCRRRGLKVNAGKSKVMVSEFKYLGYVSDESGTDEAEGCRKVVSGRIVVGAKLCLWLILVCLQLEFARILHETFLMFVLMYDSETSEKERSRIRAAQMDNLRGLLGITKMNRVPNVQIREVYGVVKAFSIGLDILKE